MGSSTGTAGVKSIRIRYWPFFRVGVPRRKQVAGISRHESSSNTPKSTRPSISGLTVGYAFGGSNRRFCGVLTQIVKSHGIVTCAFLLRATRCARLFNSRRNAAMCPRCNTRLDVIHKSLGTSNVSSVSLNGFPYLTRRVHHVTAINTV